jgi:hypothetical protein
MIKGLKDCMIGTEKMGKLEKRKKLQAVTNSGNWLVKCMWFAIDMQVA